MSDIIEKILKNVKVDLTEAYDRNFENKAFFSGAPWKPTKQPVAQGSLLLRTSAMRNSIRSKIEGESIVFTSAKPYTAIHNDGGQIKRVSKKGKNYTITIPQRQFIGQAPEVEQIIKENIEEVLPGAINGVLSKLFNNG